VRVVVVTVFVVILVKAAHIENAHATLEIHRCTQAH
jgi:hypothetical protein